MVKNIEIDGIMCKVGENAKDNWSLLEVSCKTNLFFHLTHYPSCFVLLDCKKTLSMDILKQVALVCKENTKYKNIKNISVDYTTCLNIQKGEHVGEIEYKSNRKVKKLVV